MASDYGLNFGFRRSDETLVVREGRFKVPVTGTFTLGTQVEPDPANSGYLKQSGSGETITTGYQGLLVQEEIWDRSVYAPQTIDSFYYGTARNNRLAVIVSGGGAKVWFKNTTAQNRADGRSIAAVTLVGSVSGLVVGDYLAWDGSKWAKSTDATQSLLRVTLTNGSDYVEAVLIH